MYDITVMIYLHNLDLDPVLYSRDNALLAYYGLVIEAILSQQTSATISRLFSSQSCYSRQQKLRTYLALDCSGIALYLDDILDSRYDLIVHTQSPYIFDLVYHRHQYMYDYYISLRILLQVHKHQQLSLPRHQLITTLCIAQS